MTYSVISAESAKRDVLGAAQYIEEKLHNPIAADHLLDEAEDAIGSLEEMPHRHPLVNDEYLASKGIRVLPVRNYLAFYVVRETQKTVVIQRFLYGKRDWAAILKSSDVPEDAKP
ncbi:MAG: type II toxin-antitoxin system RelE/ParE family toxin [Oscillospiraceae bacterium]|nr:type II toxin-antitoxin system RelE/ParE family toxin [Oscillospiraceae bacterium]